MTTPLALLTAARELPPDDDWLQPAEQAILRRLRWPRRRRDFRLGRLAAKCALALVAGCDGALARRRFEVRPVAGGAPQALGQGRRLAPASVDVVPATGPVSGAGWRRFSFSASGAAAGLQGFRRAVRTLMLTVAGRSDEPRLAGNSTHNDGRSI